MKRRILPFALALGITSCLAISAQTPDSQAAPQDNQAQGRRHQMDPDRQLKGLTKRLNLTSDQQNQIRSILEDRAQQMQAIRADSSLAPKDRGAKVRALRQDSDTKIKAVLNDDQKQKYDQLQQDMRDRMQQRRGGGSNNQNN